MPNPTAMPPLPPGAVRPQGGPPQAGYGAMVGGQQPGMSGMGGPPAMGGPGGAPITPGQGQLATMGIRVAMEIDMNLKQLAQIAPMMAPWVMRITEELKLQLAQAMSGGGVPSSPAGGASMWPDGTGRL